MTGYEKLLEKINERIFMLEMSDVYDRKALDLWRYFKEMVEAVQKEEG
jgi:hypothetical protein